MKTIVRRPRNTWNEFPVAFEDLFNDWNTGSSLNHLPAVNISEDTEQYKVEVNAPGFSKEDFKIHVENNTLTISVEKKVVEEEKADKYTRKEFEYRSFERSFKLPKDHINEAKISANYESGILKLGLPKAEEVKPKPARMIEIA
tara:strand:+ start:5970 stop:6401 length:432 start_codon:yes stop_codon:yes gene_type:complete